MSGPTNVTHDSFLNTTLKIVKVPDVNKWPKLYMECTWKGDRAKVCSSLKRLSDVTAGACSDRTN